MVGHFLLANAIQKFVHSHIAPSANFDEHFRHESKQWEVQGSTRTALLRNTQEHNGTMTNRLSPPQEIGNATSVVRMNTSKRYDKTWGLFAGLWSLSAALSRGKEVAIPWEDDCSVVQVRSQRLPTRPTKQIASLSTTQVLRGTSTRGALVSKDWSSRQSFPISMRLMSKACICPSDGKKISCMYT